MCGCLCCGYSSRDRFFIFVNTLALIVSVIFLILHLVSPSFTRPAHDVLIATLVAWALSASLFIAASCTHRNWLVYLGIFVELIALCTFTYFVVLVPYIYLIVILVVLIVWWIFSVTSAILGHFVRQEIPV